MNKCLLFFVLSFFVFTGQIHASSVSQSQAQNIALNYFKIQVPSAAANSQLSVSLVYTQTETDGSADFYIYNVSPMKGFVIVSGDNNAIPVIGWSSESNFTTGDYSRIGLSDWMQSTAIRIHYIVTNHIQADANIQNLWSSYAQGLDPQVGRSGSIGPLCTTTWNQVPYYNQLCPPAGVASTSSNKSVTGCVATAMAQIMKYWNYPAKGIGSHTYDEDSANGYSENYGNLSADFTRPLYWANMPNSVSSNTDPTDSLMYELGVSVEMDYAPSGSGAEVLISETLYPGNTDSASAQYSYANYFYYNPHTMQGVQYSSYTTSAWIALMENEINSGRVVQYEGYDVTAGGHTWVMDGYQAAAGGDMLHMNWGWGGVYDGFFAVTNLATPGFNPTTRDAALIGIQPLWPFSVTLNAPASICPSGSATLSAQGPANATYTWTPATTLSCNTCASPTASPASTTLYTVTVDSAGVTTSLSVAVSVVEPVTAGFTFSGAASCSLPENVSFANTSANGSSYLWNFGDNTTSTATAPVHPYTADGTYTVSLIATNACGVDTVVQTQAVTVTGGAPTGTSATVCPGQTATVSAAGSYLSWFSDAAGTNSVGSGNTYTTPVLTATTTYYVNASVSPLPDYAGPATDASSGLGGASNYTYNGLRGMYFDCSVAQTLNTVNVYATGAGGRQFILMDSAATTVYDSLTVDLPNTSGIQTVPLYFTIPAGGSYLLAVNGVANLIRNSSGAIFPYTSGDGTVQITGNNANAAGRFYYFYDWQFQQNPCTTPLAAVTAYVLGTGSGAGSFTAVGTGTPTVTFSPADQSATSYTWNFGDGSAVSTQMSPVHTYATGGIYTVELIISNGNCADTITRPINTATVQGIKDLTSFASLSVFPNPATDKVTVNVNSSKALSGCGLNIKNILGQNVYSKDADLNEGNNPIPLDVSNLTSGVYFISLNNGKDEVTTKFVKE